MMSTLLKGRLHRLINGWLNPVLLAGLFMATFPYTLNAQAARKPLRDISPAMEEEYTRLKKTGNIHKRIPEAFEKQILFALSYFPELKDTRIRFRLKKGGNGIIATRPAWSGIFLPASKRTYIVIINDSSGKKAPRLPLWRNSGVNGQVGIVGHELCHILYFNNKSGLGLIGLGIRHVSKKYMDGFENRTDSVDIERGLAYQLIDWNIYLRKAFGMKNPEVGPDPFAQSDLQERYMSPATIRRIISKHPLYQGI
ncbi:MAG: hypothetical protein EOP49_08055 [Sphingobacteriales bacterium]|nr:MAG: hypothetical protein EOP49_08055 [Sphingobacteriales bacterium]